MLRVSVKAAMPALAPEQQTRDNILNSEAYKRWDMAEEQHPVTHGELIEIVRRLDERISSMDRRIDERFETVNERIASLDRNLNERLSTLDRNMNQNLTEMRSDIRMLTRAMIGFYAFIIASVGVAFTLYKLFPNIPPTP